MSLNIKPETKKSWTTPCILESASIGSAQLRKNSNNVEAVLNVGGIMVTVGPAS